MKKKDVVSPEIRKRNFKLGLNSIIMSVIVVGILVFITLFAYSIPWTYDMTKDQIFTLSGQTVQVLSQMETAVNIVVISPESQEDPMVKSLLQQYVKEGNGKVSVEYIDAERDPGSLSKYNLDVNAVLNGSVIFSGNGRTKLLNVGDMYKETSTNLSFSGEHQITGAINYITAKVVPKIYFLEGHNEASVQGTDTAQADRNLSTLKERLEVEAYQVERINLLRQATIPDDASMLIVASPQSDLTIDEAKTIETYMQKGGAAIFLLDVLPVGETMTNIRALLGDFGVGYVNNFVVEEDPEYYYSNNKTFVIPNMGLNDITEILLKEKRYVILPVAVAIHQMPDIGDDIAVEILLQTTGASWIRTNVTINNTEMTSEDDPGPADIALEVAKDNSADKLPDTRLIVLGNSSFVSDKFIGIQGNMDFFINCVNWSVGSRMANTVRPRVINANTLDITGEDFKRLAIISIGVFPVVAFAAAFVIWFFRRHL